MTERTPSPALTLCVVLLIALNLRPALASMGVVLDSLRTDLHVSRGAAGLLTSFPILLMGVCAPLALTASRRLTLPRAMMLALMCLSVGVLLRALANTPAQWISACLVGMALAVLGPLHASFIKATFNDNANRISAWSTTALCLGASATAWVTAELATKWAWPLNLASMAVPALITAWLCQRLSTPAITASATRAHADWRQLLRDWRAWNLLLSFGASSVVFFAVLIWLTPFYVDQGLSTRSAGRVLSVFTLVQILGAFAMSLRVRPHGDRRLRLWWCNTLILLGLAGLYLAPLWATYAWVSLLGVGVSGVFALHMMLPLDSSHDAEHSLRLMTMMSSGGFVMASAGPYCFGLLRDATGGYDASLLLLAVMTLTSMLCSIALTPNLPSRAERHAL